MSEPRKLNITITIDELGNINVGVPKSIPIPFIVGTLEMAKIMILDSEPEEPETQEETTETEQPQ